MLMKLSKYFTIEKWDLNTIIHPYGDSYNYQDMELLIKYSSMETFTHREVEIKIEDIYLEDPQNM
jgi:hypothetical protein